MEWLHYGDPGMAPLGRSVTWAKRLESGRFIGDWRGVRDAEMDWTGLKLLLEGIEVRRMRKRFSLRTSAESSSARGMDLR